MTSRSARRSRGVAARGLAFHWLTGAILVEDDGVRGYDDQSYGDGFADVYDDWYADISDVEATTATLKALAAEGPVLELGIGTGRLALPLAATGVVVAGVDSSPAMLDRLRDKAAACLLMLEHLDRAGHEGPAELGKVEALLAALHELAGRRRMSEAMVQAQRESLSSDWFRHILAYDPAPTLRQLHTPTLVLFAALDHQIAPSLNEAPARAALAGNPAAEVRVLPGVNHLFLNTRSGAVSEYPRLAGGLSSVLLLTLQDWLDGQSRRGQDQLIATADIP